MNAMAEAMSNDPDQTVLLGLMQKLQSNPTIRKRCSNSPTSSCVGAIWIRAENFINRAAVASPSDARPPFYLGVLLERRGDYVKAASSLERALGMKDIPEARFSLAILLIYRLDDKAAGKAQLETLLCLSGPERRSEGSCRNGAEKAVNAPIPFEDTIAAGRHRTGAGGVGVIRISGPRAKELLERVFRPSSSQFRGFVPA